MKFLERRHLIETLQSDYFLLALLSVPAVLPLALNGGLPNTADGVLHLYRTFELDRAWKDGVWYPRLAPDFAYGYGYPIFNYYAPLFYFLSEVFHVAGLNLEWAVKAAIMLIFYLYPLGMYLFVRALLQADMDVPTRRAGALTAAVAYLYAPYRFYEAFIQGDYPQFLGLAIVPFCLWAVTPLSRRGQGTEEVGHFRFFTFVAAYAALVLSHNITALIATPLIGAYMLFLFFRQAARSSFRFAPMAGFALRYALAVGLSVALTAFFWVPALGEQQYVRIEKLTHGFFDFRNYFLKVDELLSPNIPPDIAGVNPYIPFNLGPLPVAFAVLGLCVALARLVLRSRSPQIAPQVFFACAALGLAAMTLPVSTFVWEHAPLLPLTEFPWRFVGVAAIPLAALVGIAVYELGTAVHRPGRGIAQIVTALAMVLIALDCFVYLFPRTPFLKYGNPSLSDITRFELGSQALGTTSAGEYLPIWTQRRMYDSPITSQLLRDAMPDHLHREALPVTVRVAVVAQTVTREAYRFNSVGDLTVRVQRIYFPGWKATIDGKPVPLELVAPFGVMQVQAPAGEHVVEFSFGETNLRLMANGISLAGLILCAGAWAYRRRGARAHEFADAASVLKLPEAAVAAAALIAFYFIAPHIGYVRYSTLPNIIGMQNARDDKLGDEMRLLGYDLSSPNVVAGSTLGLTLYWQPLRLIQQDYAVFAHLDNPLTLETVAQTWNERPGNISTVELPLSLHVRDSHVLRVPSDVEPGVYLLRIGMVNPRTNQALSVIQADGVRRTRLLLQPIRVRRASPPDMSAITRVGALFDSVELIGYALDAQNGLTLYWRSTQAQTADATVFVHLLDASGQPIHTFDGPPAGGLLPLSAWLKDEVVMDRSAIEPRSPRSPTTTGVFRIAVGLYDPRTLRRYPARMPDGRQLAGDQFTLNHTLEIKP